MARNLFGPMGVMTTPADKTGQVAPANNMQPSKGSVDVIAQKYRVPRNVLMALEESGGDIEAKALEISEGMKQGKTMEDIVPYASLLRANDIADEIEGIKAEGGLGKAIGVGIDGLQQAYGSAVEGAGKSLGIDGMQEYGARVAADNAAEAASGSRGLTGLTDIDGVGSGASYVGETIAQQVPQLGTTLGPIAAGAAIGSIVPGVGTAIGAGVGAAAAYAGNIAQFYGFNRERQKEENDGQVNEGAAFGTAFPQAATDLAGDALTAVPFFGQAAKGLAAGNMAARIMKGAALGVAAEAPTEAAQQAMERAQAGLPLANKEAGQEYLESAVAGGLVGGAMGGVRGGLSKRQDAAPETPAKKPQLALPAPTNGGTIFGAAPTGPVNTDPSGDGSVKGQEVGAGTTPPKVSAPTSDEPTGLAAKATARTPRNEKDPEEDINALSLDEAKARLTAIETRIKEMVKPPAKVLAKRDDLMKAVEAKMADDAANAGPVEVIDPETGEITTSLPAATLPAKTPKDQHLANMAAAKAASDEHSDALDAMLSASDDPAEIKAAADALNIADVKMKAAANVTADYLSGLTKAQRKEALYSNGSDTAPIDAVKVATGAEVNPNLPTPKAEPTPPLAETSPPVKAEPSRVTSPPKDDAERIARRDMVAPWETPANSVKQTLTEDEAREYGAMHFNHGYKRLVPPNIRVKHGEGASAAWRDGWDKAEAVETAKFKAEKAIKPKAPADAAPSGPRVFINKVVSITKSGVAPPAAKDVSLIGKPDVGNIPLRWDEKEGGFMFARAQTEKVLKAAQDQAAKAEPVKTEVTDKSPSQEALTPGQAEAAIAVNKVVTPENKEDVSQFDLGNTTVSFDDPARWKGPIAEPIKAEKPAERKPELPLENADHDAIAQRISDFIGGYPVLDRIREEARIYGFEKLAFEFRRDAGGGRRDSIWVTAAGKVLSVGQKSKPKAIRDGVIRDTLSAFTNVPASWKPESLFSPAPKAKPSPKSLGNNVRGRPLFEDENGVRSYSDNGVTATEAVSLTPTRDRGYVMGVNKSDRGKDFLTQDEWDAANTAQTAPKPEPASAPKPAATGLLSGLSAEKQARAAELKAKLAAKVRNQTSSGLDPDYIILGGELVALYIEGGAKKFGQMLRDFAETTGLSMKEAQAPMRAAYNHVRDDMDLNGEDISGMDSGEQVMAEVRKALAAEVTAKPSQNTAKGGSIEAEPANEAQNEQQPNQEGNQGESSTQSPKEGLDGEGRPDGEPTNDERGEGDEGSQGNLFGDEPSASVGVDPGSVSNGTVEARRGTAPPNFIITDDFALGEGTAGQKLAANMDALRLVRALEAENRYATADEQAVLARWVGWGGLKTVFDGKHEGATTQWGRAQAELLELLNAQEYANAMRSANDAHYTSRTVVKAMWRAMRNFGFDGGRALEPTIGSGNFLGLQPADLSASTEWFAAELDPVTGLIAKHLYPQAKVFDATGFQDAPFRRATFDIAIGNPPFGSTKIGNKKLHPDLGKMSVHNFIIAKTGQLLRDGGVMSVVVTTRFLDTANPEARKALAPDFNFLGAVRLPNTAFEANAGTEVTTDIVFFQKRKPGEAAGDQSWLETGVEGPNGTTLNGYFAANPDMILGRAAMDGTMYAGGRDPKGKGEFTVHADGRDIEASLNEAIDRIEATIPTRDQALEAATTANETSSTLQYGAMMLTNGGRIFRGEEDAFGGRVVQEVTAETFWKDNAEAQGRFVQKLKDAIAAKSDADMDARLDANQRALDASVELGLVDLAGDPVKQTTKFEQAMADSISNLIYADKPRKDAVDALSTYERAVERKRIGSDGFAQLASLLDLRQKTRELISLERADAPEGKLEAKRRALRRAYKQFQKGYGYINNSKNEAILRGDVGPEFALELHYKAANKEGQTESASEAPILQKRVIFPHKMPTSVASVGDGLHVSMQERGFVDPKLIGTLTGKTTEEVVKEMVSGDRPMALLNPKTGNYETAEVYLSGNLAEKIKASEDAGLYQNVPHLQKAMPPPKSQDQITPSIRSLWIPAKVFNEFLSAMGYSAPKVVLSEAAGLAAVDVQGGAALTEFGQQFLTGRMTPAQIFEHAIKGKIPVVTDRERKPGGGYRDVKNEEDTREAVVAYERMTKEFPEWAYANPQRAGDIIDAFNEKMNVVTERTYQGVRYLRMVGNSPEIDLRNSQLNGAWRMIQDKVTLLHHVVGAGKTFTAIVGIMERKRMGLTRKAVVAVPNHLTGQWGREWLELYPAANILVPTDQDFEPANRAKLINRIATGDFDAVIIGHSQLTKIENDPKVTQKYITEQIHELNAALQQQRRDGGSQRTIGQIGTRLTNLTAKLEELKAKLDGKADSRVIGWHELGVDYLTVDEAHLFKNLEYTTTATQLVGMNPSRGSQRAFDMLMKVRTLQGMKQGGVAFLTGTPVSNSLVEIYSMMKYLIPESLVSMNIQSFDSWKAAFIQDESRFEYTASMQLKERNIMSGMINLGPLSQLYRSFSDIVMRPDVERMFSEQMEARNAAEPDASKHVPTRFPTPKIKGGKRRINLAPPTERMKEFVRYLVMRMGGVKENTSNRAYKSIDNSLWVLTDARKASIDIRTIDPTLGREEGSKVDRSSAEVFRIWDENAERKGAQMVFCDMSAPTKTATVDANRVLKQAYEKIGLKKADLKARLEADSAKDYAQRWGDVADEIERITSSPDTNDAKRDSLNEFMESGAAQDAAAAMFTADTGFSFYDDMKALLIEKGVPEKEIAFIHDYDTTIQKAQLFEAVNEGAIRVLIGSTQKMGAGTNAQKRLVALHHIDAPWRPSDMEQREGRIIRQGNLFYEQDPEGFEIEIIAYSTEQTADVVQWQTLERKAKSIETFMDATADNIAEEGGDADQYAEFMAQSTGKEVFLEKMQAEKERDDARARIASTVRTLAEADTFLKNHDRDLKLAVDRQAAYKSFSMDLMPDGADSYLAEWEASVAAYKSEKERVEAEADATRKENENLPAAEKKKLPKLPSAPVRWEDKPKNRFEAAIVNMLEALKNDTGQRSGEVSLGGGFKLRVLARPARTLNTVEYTPYLIPPNNHSLSAEVNLIGNGWDSAEAIDFRRSDKLLNALSPANIAMKAEQRVDRYKVAEERQLETLPQMQAVKDRGVDMSSVAKAEANLARLSAMVRIEEVKFAAESASIGTNYFANRDDKGRDLSADDTAQPLIGDFEFQNAGVTYTSQWGAPNGVRKIDGTTRSGAVVIFEAEGESYGDSVIIEAINTADQSKSEDDSWSVLNVWDDPNRDTIEDADFEDVVEGAPRRKKTFIMRMEDDGGPATSEMRDWTEVEADDPVTDDDIRAITKDLNAELGRTGLAGKVSVRVVRNLISRVSGNEIAGRFGAKAGITVNASSQISQRGIMRHEIIHALRSAELWNTSHGLFTPGEWRGLVQAARAEPQIVASVMARYKDQPDAMQAEEMVAELYRLWAGQRDQYSGVEKALGKVEAFLRSMANLLRGRGFGSAALTMERIAGGKVGGRGPDGGGNGRTDRSRPNVQYAAEMRAPAGAVRDKFKGLVGTVNWRDPAAFIRNVTTDMITGDKMSLLALVPGRALFAEMGANLLSSKRYLRAKEEMDTLRGDWHAAAADVAQSWIDMQKKNPDANEGMMDLMHRSTLTGVDPSKPDTWGRNDNFLRTAKMEFSKHGDAAPDWVKQKLADRDKRARSYAAIKALYDALPAEYQAFYVTVKDSYEKMADDFDLALEDNIRAGAKMALKRAEREHRKTLRQIKDDGLTGAEKQDKIDEAELTLEKVRARAANGAASQIKTMRAVFEGQRLKGPYFPMARFGNYFVTVRDAKGTVINFSRFESEKRQQVFKAEQEELHPGRVRHGLMSNSGDMKDQVDGKFVADVEMMLADSGASAEVMDAIWQRYLETMPDQSIRTSKIHRKGREGWNKDALRSYTSHTFHGAHQLARLKYGLELQDSLDDAEEEARRADDPNRATALVNEMRKRMEWTMNPTGASWSAAASSMAFVWYLGVSPAAGIVNLTQTTVIGPAIMVAGLKSATYPKALAALGRAAKDFANGQGTSWKDTWTTENSDSLTADEKAAMAEGYRRGTIDKTQGHDLAAVAESGIEFSPFREKWMKRIGFAFHHAERFNREVTFLAAYRLARADGMNHTDAIEKAADLTWKTHFSYQNSDRPRFMQGDITKVLFIFRQFSVNMLYRLFRDAHQSLQGKSKAERKEARAQLVGVTLSMMAHAGFKGVWGYSLLMGLLALFFPGDDDDIEEWMQDALLMEGDSLGVAAANYAVGAFLNGVPGQLTGINMTTRIGMPDLWFRGSDRTLEGDDVVQQYINELAGPIGGIAFSVFGRGLPRLADGDIVRGVEASTPKFVRDVVKTFRYAKDGVTTWNGDDLIESLNPWELLMQANGFTPARVAERYEINTRLKNKEKEILDERKDIHRAASDAFKEGEPISEKVMDQIRDFNKRFPEYPITGKTIRQSFKGRQRASMRNEFGVSLNPKLNDRLRGDLAPSQYN